MTREKALSTSIDEVPSDFVLKPFLMMNKSEVSGMLLTEYNEAEVMELFKEDGRREGREEGKEEGTDKHLISQIVKKLKKGKSVEIIANEVEEEIATVTLICNVAKKYAPDYDVDEIYRELFSANRQ